MSLVIFRSSRCDSRSIIISTVYIIFIIICIFYTLSRFLINSHVRDWLISWIRSWLLRWANSLTSSSNFLLRLRLYIGISECGFCVVVFSVLFCGGRLSWTRFGVVITTRCGVRLGESRSFFLGCRDTALLVYWTLRSKSFLLRLGLLLIIKWSVLIVINWLGKCFVRNVWRIRCLRHLMLVEVLTIIILPPFSHG